VSYGRTVERHITKEEGYLSYPSAAIVTVFGKQVLVNEQGEFWEAEVSISITCVYHSNYYGCIFYTAVYCVCVCISYLV